MTETLSERSTTSGDSGSDAGDQANRSERDELQSAADSGGTTSDRLDSHDVETATGQDASESGRAGLGSNDTDSRLSATDEDAPGADSSDVLEPGMAGVEPLPLDDGARHEIALEDYSEPNASQAPKPEPNASQASKTEPNSSETPKPEPNASHAPKPEPNASHAPKQQPGQSETPKHEAPNKDTLTKEQITKIIGDSKSLNELKANLGLGPATDKALSDYLASKGISPPGSIQQTPGPVYTGPSIGPTATGQEVVTRTIMVTDQQGGTVKVECHGTERELNALQDIANNNAMLQMLHGLSSAGSGMLGARSAGPDTYRGGGTPGSGPRW
jgi:hypothetical protein